ncbi:Transcriptional regulator AglR, LacI family [hydrothermal vent metagenome]|uniref:Transcriptional regulator AglR, LacI family n=1 Tax=hydrothermal vent metagenome TaxID=652676 RepID=A0A3B0ULE7_9ZZZZ
MTKLKDIARHLGLSTATVSRALNGFPEVGAATRARVIKASRELNYSPNSTAKRLATGKAGVVGMVFRSARNLLLDPHFVDFLAGMSLVLAERQIDLMIHVAPPGQQLDHYKRFMASSSVDGMIVSAPEADDLRIKTLLEAKFPFVVHGRTGDNVPYAFYDIDNDGALSDAVRLLYQLGHRRIAFINGPRDLVFARQRLMAFKRELAERGIGVPEIFISHDEMREDLGYKRAAIMLGSNIDAPPSAFICSSTLTALGVMRATTEAGLKAGRDISIIAHDDVLPHFRSEHFSVPLTVTRAPIREAGIHLAEMIEAVVEGADPVSQQHIQKSELIVRASTGAVPRGGGNPW